MNWVQSLFAENEGADHYRVILWRAIICATFALLLYDSALRIAWAFNMPVLVNDFQVFYRAAGQSNPYEIVNHIDNLRYRPFLSPPTLLPWLGWLNFLPFKPAWAIWTLLGISCYLLAAKPFVGFPRDILALFSFGSIEVAISGQVTFFLAAALMLAFSTMKTRPILSGIIFGLVASAKPQVVLALPIGLASSKEWQTLAAVCLTGIIAGIASISTHGIAMWFEWLAVIQQFAQWLPSSSFHYFGLTPNNLAAFLNFDPYSTQIICALGIFLGLWTVRQVFRQSEDPQLRLGAVIVGYLLCSRYALVYEMAFIAPLAATWLLDRKASPIGWISGALAIACSTGQFTHLHLGVFAPPMLAIALLVKAKNDRTLRTSIA